MSTDQADKIFEKIHGTNPAEKAHAKSFADYLNVKATQNNDRIQNIARNIDKLNEPKDPERVEACRKDLKLFCMSYYPELFYLDFSPDQLELIKAIQAAVFQGAFQAVALPRASGKTTICEIACIWALMYQHKEFVLLVGATKTAAKDSLKTITMHLENCDELRADYPLLDECLSMAAGSSLKAARITYKNKPLNFIYRTEELSIPTIPEKSGTIPSLTIAGIEGRIRGLKRQTVDGRSLRPDLILVDDVQTRASAESPSKVVKRERIIKSDIMGLAGPDKSISGMIACTVIKQDDLADRILNREKNPQFRGIRGKLVYEMPKNMDLWDQYFMLRAESLLEHGDNRDGNEHYKTNRVKMDEGSKVAWNERKKDGQLSGLQYAMDLLADDKISFYSEFQNEPLDDVELSGREFLTPEQVREKATRAHKRGIVPTGHTKLTAFVDVQKSLLYYVVVAWNPLSFGGHIVDYGAFPNQETLMFKANDAPVPFAKVYPNHTLEAQMYDGLSELCNGLFSMKWIAEDEQELRLSRLLIDANYAKSTNTVYEFCKQSPFAALVDPHHGKYFGAATTPMNSQKKQKGETRGDSWVMPSPRNNRKRRYVISDSNYWKSFVIDRMKLSLGDSGTISLFGEPDRHEMFSQQICSEVSIETSGRGRQLEEWKLRGTHFENHWFDCLYGAAVAASIEGLKTDVEQRALDQKRKTVRRGTVRRFKR